jgi:hypothetical protein
MYMYGCSVNSMDACLWMDGYMQASNDPCVYIHIHHTYVCMYVIYHMRWWQYVYECNILMMDTRTVYVSLYVCMYVCMYVCTPSS